MFRDQFTDFIFNNVSSKTMKVWITNSHDLKENIVPSLQDEYVAPSLVDGRYYSGTTISSSKMSLQCIAINITAQEKRDITRWLAPRATGRLIFGYDLQHYYNVKVSSEIIANKWVRSRYDSVHGGYLYIYNFTVQFETIDDWALLGNPISFDLSFLKKNEQLLHDSISNYSFDFSVPVTPYTNLTLSSNEYPALLNRYLFNNNNNSAHLATLLCHDNIFLPAGIYDWEDIKEKLHYKNGWQLTSFYFLREPNITQTEETGSLPYISVSYKSSKYCVAYNFGITDIYPSANNEPELSDQSHLVLLYPCIVDAPLSNSPSAGNERSEISYLTQQYSICNSGTLPMYYDYFINGICSTSEEGDPDDQYQYYFKIELNEETEYSMGLMRPYNNYYYNFNIESKNGIIMNNGNFCENLSSGFYEVNLENFYYTKGTTSIVDGQAEILDLHNFKIQPKGFFKSSQASKAGEISSRTWEYISFDLPNLCKYDHYGFAHISLYDGLNTLPSGYSIDNDEVFEDYTLQYPSIDLPVYVVPYIDSNNQSWLKCIASPTDFLMQFDRKMFPNFLDKVVAHKKTDSTGKEEYDLYTPSTSGIEWASTRLYNFKQGKDYPFTLSYKYMSIGNAQHLNISMSGKSSLQTPDLGEIFKESLNVQTREV